jgi:energy-converting hydrogenase Eha subunit H
MLSALHRNWWHKRRKVIHQFYTETDDTKDRKWSIYILLIHLYKILCYQLYTETDDTKDGKWSIYIGFAYVSHNKFGNIQTYIDHTTYIIIKWLAKQSIYVLKILTSFNFWKDIITFHSRHVVFLIKKTEEQIKNMCEVLFIFGWKKNLNRQNNFKVTIIKNNQLGVSGGMTLPPTKFWKIKPNIRQSDFR